MRHPGRQLVGIMLANDGRGFAAGAIANALFLKQGYFQASFGELVGATTAHDTSPDYDDIVILGHPSSSKT